MKATFGAAGGASTKYLTFYKAAKNAISGSIASMRSGSIGAISVSNAYDRTVTLTFNSSTNSTIYNTLKSYFSSGNQTLIIYVPSTRGTHSGGFCYDYLSVTAMTLEFTFQYLKSDGSMAASSVAAGSAATVNITAYNSQYTHKVIWKFGAYSYTQSVAAGISSTSYTIPLTWLNAIPSATSGSASATLETYNASGSLIGSTVYGFTITVPSSVVPTIGSVTITPINSNSVISGWGIYVQGKTQARVKINNAAGAFGSTITGYSISNSYLGTVKSSTMTTAAINKSGTFTMTATVTDSRGRTATKTASFTVYAYTAPSFSSINMYRCNSSGARSDTEGTYGYVKASFGCSILNGSNKVTATAKLSQIGGTYSTSTALTSGTGVI